MLTITRFYRELRKGSLITIRRNLAHSSRHGGGILESETCKPEGVGAAVVVDAGQVDVTGW
jgi:hypothetical protein